MVQTSREEGLPRLEQDSKALGWLLDLRVEVMQSEDEIHSQHSERCR